jgi:hypothetical protein
MAGDPQLMRTKAMQTRDDSVEEVPAGIDIDAAQDPLGKLTEIGREMEQQIDPGREEKQTADETLDRNHAQDERCPRWVGDSRDVAELTDK